MSAENVVVVESPAKAKTINKYLGGDFEVVASYGHVRDLPPKDGSVEPDRDFAMHWDVDGRAKKRIDELAQKLRGAKRLYLATDPDREGEAISWHMREELARRKVLDNVEVNRVVFHEITKNAVLDAMRQPRRLNDELIEAYLARRALDYLVGFTLSPVLWRKLPGAKSAGRVQSVALRLVCEREAEIEAFRPQEYWSIDAAMTNPQGQRFSARLTRLDGEKLDKFALGDEAAATRAVETVRAAAFSVAKVERKQTKRNPAPPFTTSTLQQEASRKLYFGATKTMTLAQKLYEGVDIGGETIGLITYMRTDSTNLSEEALRTARELVAEDHGDAYLPNGPRRYRTKAKNAQEAHEAIRPTDMKRRPAALRQRLEPDMYRLYELIWKRAVASQMASAEIDQVAAELADSAGRTGLRATGSSIRFDGFLTLYHEDEDDPNEDSDEGRKLPPLTEGDATPLVEATPNQHFTQPPPRYSEASLVKKMEELGIGRPSTYASILKVLQDREYVRLEKRRFVPEDRGRLVVAFLTSFYERYFSYDFTAALEEQLDEISDGQIDWKAVLRDFWEAFSAICSETMDLSPQQVRETIDRELGPHFFPADENGSTEAARVCPACSGGRLALNFGKFGAFIACSNYPDCKYTRDIGQAANDPDGNGPIAGEFPRELGYDPETGLPVSLRKGPYGVYVQLGEGEKGKKPKRSSLPKDTAPDDVDLDMALRLLALPRELGPHPESGEPILAGLGRYGPYLRHGEAYVSLPRDDDVLTIGINRAVTVIAEAGEKGKARQTREIGAHPRDGGPITQGRGRFGPYVKHGRIYASIPKDRDPDAVTLEEAVELVDAKAAKKAAGKKGAGKQAPAKAAAKKSGGKKAGAKKASAKKSGAKKGGAKKAAARKAAAETASGAD